MKPFPSPRAASANTFVAGCACAIALTAMAATRAPQSRDRLLVQPAWLAQHLNDTHLVLLHVGPKPEYDTKHLPGARYVAYNTELFDESDRYRSQDELTAIFTKAGVKSGDTVIVYCHIGQQATAVVFAARLLGLKALLYDGSFEDWSQRDLPVARSGGGA